jgi:16S rRNA (cytosine967-C5)-methyltransferase
MADPTRDSAYVLLNAVLAHGQSLDAALDALPKIETRDRGAAHRLAATVLRHTGTLNAVLEGFLVREPPEAVRKILWLGAAASLFLKAPAHAAVGTAVDLAKTKNLLPFAGLINAVLRKVAAGGPALLDGLDMPRLDTPAWAWASWGVNAREIATAHQHEAPLDISTVAGFVPEDGEKLPTGSYRFPAGTAVPEIPGFHEGKFWVQDAAATLPAQILNPQPGEHVLDLCAAPGGKTAQLAAAGALVTAIDRDESRLGTLRGNLQRLNLTAATIRADATIWRPDKKFPAILLDAPCSATGTIRRHPDLPFIKRAQDMQALVEGQTRLLDAASTMLRPGGRLIYAVCSLQTDEGALRAHPRLEPMPFTPDDTKHIPGSHENGIVRTDPSMWADEGGLDGFQIVRYRKK